MELGGLPFGDYLPLRRLGEGGFATVYLARSNSRGSEVALKIQRGHGRRLAREHRAMEEVIHPRIPRAFECGQVPGIDIYFLALEYVVGACARDCLRDGPVSVRTALQTVAAIAEALERVHELGWVHRDVTPGNVVGLPERSAAGTNGKSNVKLIDFGITRRAGPHEGTDGHTKGTIGTPQYMPPEQWWAPERATASGDLYMLSGTLYTLLTGRAPFNEKGSVATDFPRLEMAVEDEATTRLRGLLQDTTSADPGDRLRTATDYRARVDACIETFERTQNAGTLTPQPPSESTMTTAQLPRTAALEELLANPEGVLPRIDAIDGFRAGGDYLVALKPGATYRLDRIPELDLEELDGARLRIRDGVLSLTCPSYQTLASGEGGKAVHKVFGPEQELRWPIQGCANIFFSGRGDPRYVCGAESVEELSVNEISIAGVRGVRLSFSQVQDRKELCSVVFAGLPAGVKRARRQ